MRFRMLFVVMIAASCVLPLVFAKSFASSAFYGVQPIQQPVQRDNIVLTSLPRWNTTGDYSYEAWHGLKQNSITGGITFTRMWGARMIPATKANNTEYLYLSSTRAVGNLTALGSALYSRNCRNSETRCRDKTFFRCVSDSWVIDRTCRRFEECTSKGCIIAGR